MNKLRQYFKVALVFASTILLGVQRLDATVADDLAALLVPYRVEIEAGTEKGIGTAGWADIDRVTVKLRGSKTPVHGVTMAQNSVKWGYSTSDWDEKKYSTRPSTSESYKYVKDKYPVSKNSALKDFSVIANFYINESASNSKGKVSDWITPSTSETTTNGGNYGTSYFSRHVWIQVLKKEPQPGATGEAAKPRAALYIVPFSLMQQTSASGSSTRPTPGETWRLHVNHVKIGHLTDLQLTPAYPAVGIETTKKTATKGGGLDNGIVRLTRSEMTSAALNVAARWEIAPVDLNDVQVLSGASVLPRNFNVSFAPNETVKELTVRGLLGSTYAPKQTVTISLVGGADYNVTPSKASATVDVLDPVLPTAGVVATKPDARPPDMPGEFSVNLSRLVSLPVTVKYSIGGTAQPNVRYRALPGTVTVPSGSRSVTIPLIPIENYKVAPTQTVVLSLDSGTNYMVIGSKSATVNIHDNNDNVFSIVTDNATAVAGKEPIRFRVTRSGTNLSPATLSWNVAGTAVSPQNYFPGLPSSVVFGQGVKEVAYTLNAIAPLPSNKTISASLIGNPRYTIGTPDNAIFTLVAKVPVSKVSINATIFSGANTVQNAVDAFVPEGVEVKGGIIALGSGNTPLSTKPVTSLTPQPEYLDGTWIPPVVPYGIDVRIKHITTEAQ